MKLIDLESDRDYVLDGKYVVKAGEDGEVGKTCYKIYATFPKHKSEVFYNYFCDTVHTLNYWKQIDSTVLYVRERPFTKSDRIKLGKTVFWTREEAEQAIKGSKESE